MEAAIAFAETGHLCLATLHSNNADQTLERILNFFPEAAHKNVLMNLALNLQARWSPSVWSWAATAAACRRRKC